MKSWTEETRQRIVEQIDVLSDKGEDQDEYALESFYDYNLTPHLMNKTNQIIQGSRGMGKTHILKVLERTLSKKVDKTIHCIFLDCRKIGSGITSGLSTQNEDSPYPFNIEARFFQYFLDYLTEELKAFYKYQYYEDDKQRSRVFQLLSDMKSSILTTTKIKNDFTTTITDSDNTTESTNSLGEIALLKSVNLSRRRDKGAAKAVSKEMRQDIHVRYSLSFPKFGRLLEELLETTDTRIFLLLDEWSSILTNIQPYFADFLGRTLFSISRVKFKIAVLPQGCNFQAVINGRKFGLDIGEDIKLGLDLDRIYSVDNAPSDIIGFCFSFLCQHLSVSVGSKIDKSEFVRNMFDNDKTAFMLVRASEGNPRDFITLTAMCVRDFLSEKHSVITAEKVISCAKEQFVGAKLQNCPPSAHDLLNKLVRYVVYRNHNRGFLIDSICLKNSPDLKWLITAKIIHILKENYMEYEKAMSSSCAILVLNFGTYCDALGAGKQIKFFCGKDELENKVFSAVTDKLYSLGSSVMLPYNKEKNFYVCYVNTLADNYFDPHFYRQ